MEDKKLGKAAVIVFFLLVCLLVTYYYHFILRTEIIFTHLFYISIILASLWWARKGIVVAGLFALMLQVSHMTSPLDTLIKADVIRASMLVVVGMMVAIMSETKMILRE